MLEILGGIGTLAGVGGIITFGVFAWRGRGEAIAATRRELEAGEKLLAAERKQDAAERRAFDAEATAAAAGTKLRVATEELERTRGELAAERIAKGKLYAELAARGAPVGDVVVDSALDGLPFAEGDRKAGEGGDPDPGSR